MTKTTMMTMATKVRLTGTRTARMACTTLAALAALVGATTPTAAQDADRADFLVDARWLAERLGDPDLVLLQVGPEETWAAGHVPGAVRVDLASVSKPMPTDGDHSTHLALEMPEPAALESYLEGLGVSSTSRIVIVPSDGWITPAARVLFTLDWAGLGDRTVFLDGGLEAWRAAGGAVVADAPTPAPGSLELRPRTDRVVSADWIRSGGASADGFALLDARAGAFYDGVRDDRGLSGHIEGAATVPWAELYDETDDGVVTLRPIDEVRARLAEAGVEPGDTVVAYCHIGQFATGVLLAARAAGHEVRLFDGSMNQWALLGLPVRRPGRETP